MPIEESGNDLQHQVHELEGQVRDLKDQVCDLKVEMCVLKGQMDEQTKVVQTLVAGIRSSESQQTTTPHTFDISNVEAAVERTIRAVVPGLLEHARSEARVAAADGSNTNNTAAAAAATPSLAKRARTMDGNGDSGSMPTQIGLVPNRLPTDATVRTGWIWWWLGDPALGLTHPIRKWGDDVQLRPPNLQSLELSNYYNWARLYTCMEAFLRDQHLVVSYNPNQQQVLDMLSHCWPILKRAYSHMEINIVGMADITATSMSRYVPTRSQVDKRQTGKWELWEMKSGPRHDATKSLATARNREEREFAKAAEAEAKRIAKMEKMERNKLKRKAAKRLAAQVRRARVKEAKLAATEARLAAEAAAVVLVTAASSTASATGE